MHEFANPLVENTIRQFDNVEIIDEPMEETTSIESGDLSPEQYDETMQPTEKRATSQKWATVTNFFNEAKSFFVEGDF
ncbi:MAG: hypothetical protein J6T96_00620 [Bacteroidales bacterium]|nr:hypothetical protein [Bacteroidales bacterium]